MLIPSLRLTLLSLLTALCIIVFHQPIGSAHWADLAVADVVVGKTTAQMTLTIPTTLVAFADGDRDQRISASEFEAHQLELAGLFRNRISLTHNKESAAEFTVKPVNLESAATAKTPAAHSRFLLQYRWLNPLDALSIHYDLFPSGASPRCLATIYQNDTARSFVFTPQKTTVTLTPQKPRRQQVLSFLKLGAGHIFTGYDHILFLITLLLPGGKLISLLKIVTAFTVAHSLTLSLAALSIVTLPSVLVESLIALSIVYIAVENLWRKQFQHRWRITFAFGLIHGLGFANILRDLAGSQSNWSLSLVSFNLGVELGQIAIVLMVFLWLQVLQRRLWGVFLRRGVSLAMILMGAVWFVERAIAAI
ncbi:MAG: HupE/UreJ family protein [Leptolyngbyaceae cyanobacterium MO_188.B28]|nr:HupE/UreJ family protein [Leptolyngbyaceae cyanobacterium MO_188.B28]